MQPEGPYRFTHMLGGSPVGKAWAAIDAQGRFVSVAVLDAVVAAAPGWREAFAGIANALAQAPDGVPFAYADFSATAPWVAYSAEVGPGAERLFRALGVEFHPESGVRPVSGVPVSGLPISAPPQPVSGVPDPVSGVPQPVSGLPAPVSGLPQPTSGLPDAVPPPQPYSGLPLGMTTDPVSAPPTGIPSSPYSTSAPPMSPWDATSPGPSQPAPVDHQGAGGSYDPFGQPARRIQPVEAPKRRAGLLVGVIALVVALIVGGGTFTWFSLRGGKPAPQPTAAASPSTTVLPPALPTAQPLAPGLEPPKASTWPASWPKFNEKDWVRTYSDLDGLGFALKVPIAWQCTPAGRAQGYAKYNCGMPGAKPAMGGEIIVRDCPEPCEGPRQTEMRKAEDAWGLQWLRVGQCAYLAEDSHLQIEGQRQYGLVIVAYYRGGNSGRIDRQVVLRMSSAIDGMGRIRRVGNYLRDTLIF